MYELQNVGVTYGSAENEVHAIRNISLKIEEGEIISIIGSSGAGPICL